MPRSIRGQSQRTRWNQSAAEEGEAKKWGRECPAAVPSPPSQAQVQAALGLRWSKSQQAWRRLAQHLFSQVNTEGGLICSPTGGTLGSRRSPDSQCFLPHGRHPPCPPAHPSKESKQKRNAGNALTCHPGTRPSCHDTAKSGASGCSEGAADTRGAPRPR